MDQFILKMKRIILFLFISIAISSCTTYQLDKSVWYNLTFVEKDGQKADMTTSLHFVSEKQVDVFVSVVSDTNFIVTPFKYAEGTYNVNGNPRKEATINIDITTIDKKRLSWSGVYHKDDAMLLLSTDSVVKVYGKLQNISLP